MDGKTGACAKRGSLRNAAAGLHDPSTYLSAVIAGKAHAEFELRVAPSDDVSVGVRVAAGLRGTEGRGHLREHLRKRESAA